MAVSTVLSTGALALDDGSSNKTLIVTDVDTGGVFCFTTPTLLLSPISMTAGNPAIVSVNHKLSAGDIVVFAAGSGSLPSNIPASQPYYVLSKSLSANAFLISLTYEGGSVTPFTSSTPGITGALSYIADTGVIFNNLGNTGWWIRQYDVAEGVNVMWFGLFGDGIRDDSAGFQSAYNAGYHTYNFPQRDFLMGNINLSRPNVCLRSESAIYDTAAFADRATRIFLPPLDGSGNIGGVVFYTSADITGSRFYGLRLDGSKVTSGNSRGMIMGKDPGNVVNYPFDPYTGYSAIPQNAPVKCSFEFMEFFNFRQEGWLGENVDGAIIRSCYAGNCLSDITYLTEYRAAIAIYGNDCLIERTEAGQFGSNSMSSGAISTARTNISSIATGTSTTITTAAAHGLKVGDTAMIFDVSGTPSINGLSAPITAVTTTPTNTLTVQLNTSGSYSGGTISKGYGTAPIQSISKLSHAVVTTSLPHGFAVNDIVEFSDVSGMTQINGQSSQVMSVTSSTVFTITLDTSGYFAYSGSNGIVSDRASTNTVVLISAPGPLPTITTLAPHGLLVNNVVLFLNISGMTQINGQSVTVTSIVSPTQFQIDLDTSLYTPFMLPSPNPGIITANPVVHITGISNGANAVITTTDSNPLAIGDVVVIGNVVGMTSATGIPISGQSVYINNVTKTTSGGITTTSITVSLDTTNYTVYNPLTSGGIVSAQVRACGIGMFGGIHREGTWLNFCDGELCDAGIYVGHYGVRLTSCRNDHNAGLGYLIDHNECQVSNCSSFDNSISGTNSFDGFLITGNAVSCLFSNCLTHSDNVPAEKMRYGFNDLSDQSTVDTKTIFSNCKAINLYVNGMYGSNPAFNFGFLTGAGGRSTEYGPEIAFTTAAATPSVAGWGMWVTNNTSSTVITNFTNGSPGQVIYVRINDIHTTIPTGTSIFNKNGITNAGLGGVFQYKFENGFWYQVASDLAGVLFTQTGFVNVIDTATATPIIGTGVGIGVGSCSAGSLSLPANFFYAGRSIKIKFSGHFSTTVASGSPSLTFTLFPSTSFSTAVTTSGLPANAVSQRIVLEFTITCHATGTSGILILDGGLTYNTSGGVVLIDAFNNGGTAITFNTTIVQCFGVNAQWDSMTHFRSLTSNACFIEALN